MRPAQTAPQWKSLRNAHSTRPVTGAFAKAQLQVTTKSARSRHPKAADLKLNRRQIVRLESLPRQSIQHELLFAGGLLLFVPGDPVATTTA